MRATLPVFSTLPPLHSNGFPIHHKEIRSILPDLPRGAITEILGPASSGRTALAHSLLATATRAGEVAAIVDASNSFDPQSARLAGADLGKLLWVRAGGRVDHAFRSADIILHGGGFGLVILDLCGLRPRDLEAVPLSYWHRFRRAVETTPTVLAIVAAQAQAKSCAARQIEMRSPAARWSGEAGGRLLRGLDFEMGIRKPVTMRSVAVHAAAA